MPSNLKFPPTVEIKRAIAAAERAGISIGSIEIHPRKIVIHPKDPTEGMTPEQVAYAEWKASDQEVSRRRKQTNALSDALPTKSKS